MVLLVYQEVPHSKQCNGAKHYINAILQTESGRMAMWSAGLSLWVVSVAVCCVTDTLASIYTLNVAI